MGAYFSKSKSKKSFDRWNTNVLTMRNFEYQKEKIESLEDENGKLMKRFFELKEKYDETLDKSRTRRIEEKILNAMHETDKNVSINSINQHQATSQDPDPNNAVFESALKFESRVLNESNDELHRKLTKKSAHMDEIYHDISDELNLTAANTDPSKSQLYNSILETSKMQEEFDKQLTVLSTKHEQEKQQLNSLWESRLSDVITQLNASRIEIQILIDRNERLQELFDTVRNAITDDSKNEDLDRIADLETQIIIQKEELDKQKDIIKIMELAMAKINKCYGVDVATSTVKTVMQNRKHKVSSLRMRDISGDGKSLSLTNLESITNEGHTERLSFLYH